MHKWLATLSALVCWTTAQAQAGQTFSSGAKHVSLLELYTSEGCSSCPPAEQWLSKLAGQSGLWTDFVPVAFHVTYWDHLGWKDATGQSSFNQRERAHAAAWGTGTIYTPCVVLDGRESQSGKVPQGTERDFAGKLELTHEEDGSVKVVFSPAKAPAGNYQVTVVLLGSGISTKVRRGENAGRELAHDFVVLAQNSSPLQAASAGKMEAALSLPQASAEAPRLALAAWVETAGTIQPIQAAGGWLQ